MTPLRIGLVGCGNISDIYFKNLATYPETEVIACADLDPERAKAAAEKYGIAKALTTEALLENPDVELVLNLTIPRVHGEIAQQAVEAGKHVYNEKPLAVERAEARAFLDSAMRKGLRVGCAPDTFLGAGLQTCRKVIDAGSIGQPVAAQAFLMGWGPEGWHPNPEFFYKRGGGPMFDMGPYYLTALTTLLGPVQRVTGSARISYAERPIPRGNSSFCNSPLGQDFATEEKKIVVETPTHLSGVLDFESGVIGEITTSFDVFRSHLPNIVIYGSDGTLVVPDPNTFGGDVKIAKTGSWDFETVDLSHDFADNHRGLGVRDIADAIAENRPHRASGELAYHVLDIMHSIHDASREGKHQTLRAGPKRPEPMTALVEVA